MMKTKSDMLKTLLPFGNTKIEKFWALKGVSFDIYEGDSVGIVGLNGGGKSTLLNIVSQIIPPTSGELTVNGQTNIISVGSGLNYKLSGRENIIMKCEMLGMSNQEINDKMADIIDFAGDQVIQKIDQPVKTYSSGMKSRLGFSILVHQDPDILIIDEALSVGDAPFFEKGVARMKEFKAQGKTIMFVSHSLSQVEELCDKVIWIDHGRVVMEGAAADVLPKFQDFQNTYNRKSKAEREQITHDSDQDFTLELLRDEHPDEPERYFSKRLYDRPLTWQTWGALTVLMAVLLFTVSATLKGIPLRTAIMSPLAVLHWRWIVLLIVIIGILIGWSRFTQQHEERHALD
ncbi:ABC transporter ATP-binding protein [Lacticaseibacillus nasuensis]|uniref:ABC transporter ATP-binding protein n=1 Tax=Lacticaseibacillus nasuensis TaxID=944671 RepID=UPI00224536C2|nr:ABC transporter ATP-binding protein [Lacticaseibacillus nasuensis]MCX2456202.1 ABC transporter ATP-binding protein [Lacticaseibacillus nasuensis]